MTVGSITAGLPVAPPPPGAGDDVLIGSLRPRLRDDVEQVTGFDGTLLLFDPTAGSYTRLSGPARAVLPLLDGERSVDELVARIADRTGQPAERVGPPVRRFVQGLRQAALFEDIEPAEQSGRAKVVDAARRVPVLRLRVGGPFEGEGGSVLRLAQRLSPRPALAVWALSALGGVAVGISALALTGRHFPHVIIPVVVAFLVVQLTVHELAHAVVCRLAGARVREAGVALWYYFLPIAYVDRTDAYRVRSRTGRTAIAAAGPASDALFIGVSGALCLAGVLGGTFHVVLAAQALLMLGNVNPLLPSDLEQAFESATGLVTLRGDGMAWVAAKLLGVHRTLPASLSGPKRGLYIVYGLACVAYVILLALMLLAAATIAIVTLVGALS